MSIILFLLGVATIPLYLIYFPGTTQTVPNLLFILAGVSAIIDWWFIKGRLFTIHIPYHPFWLPSLLILLGGLLSTFVNSISARESLTEVLKQWFVFSIWMAVAVDVAYRGYTKIAINLLIIGAVFTSTIAILDFTAGLDLGPRFISSNHPVASVFGYGSTANNRFAGTFGHANAQALFLSLTMPIVLDRWLGQIKSWKIIDFFWLLLFAIMGFAIMLTGSLSGYLGIFAGCSIVLLVRLKNFGTSSKLLLPIFIGTLFVSLIGLILLLIPPLLNAILSMNSIQNLLDRSVVERVVGGSGPTRLRTYTLAIDHIIRSPLIGVGLDKTSSQLQVSNAVSLEVHNPILQLWFTSGFFGFVGILIVYWHTFWFAVSRIRNSLHTVQLPDRLGLAAATIGFLVIDMTQPGIDQRQKWLVFALLYGGMFAMKKMHHSSRQARVQDFGPEV